MRDFPIEWKRDAIDWEVEADRQYQNYIAQAYYPGPVSGDLSKLTRSVYLWNVARGNGESYAEAMWQLAQTDEHDLDGHIFHEPLRCPFCDAGKRGLVYSSPDGGWVHPDIREGNAFGRYEAEQEARVYLANPV